MKWYRPFTFCLALGMLCATLSMVGCGSSQDNDDEVVAISADTIRKHYLSPELASIAMTEEELKNRRARTVDTNMRQIPDDIDNIWLLDRPLWLSIYPIP